MAFTEQEKAQIRHHLDYPGWTNLAPAVQLGYPAASQPQFLLEDAFHRLLPSAEEMVRYDLCQCNDIECQMGKARSRMRTTKLGDLQVQEKEADMLRRELSYWRDKLASDLGVQPNPYSRATSQGQLSGGRNATVIG